MIEPAGRLGLIPPYLFAEMSRVKAEAVARGVDIVDLGIGDPDLPTPEPVREALKRAVDNPATHRYDETARGWTSFLEAAAEFYEREFGVNVDPATDLCEVIGSKEGLAHLAWAYAARGDVVIVPNPGYTVYKVNALMAGAEVYETPLRETSAFLPVLEDIPVDIARRAKLFYVCYPHNPTGATATAAFYRDLVRFCTEHEILLVNDMAYATVTFDGFKSPTVLQQEGGKETSIEFHSLSKMFNMTGWRLGFAVGHPEAVATLQRLKSNIDSKQFPAIAEAGAFALREVDNSGTLRVYRARRDALVRGLAAIGWDVPTPKASFYVWARVPHPEMTSAQFCTELLERTGVLVIPGNGYGREGEGYVRMSLTVQGDSSGERMIEAVKRIGESGLVKSAVNA